MSSSSHPRVGFRETLGIIKRAFSISIRTKGKASMLVSILGFPAALLPAAIALLLRSFTDSIQSLTQGRAEIRQSFMLLGLLILSYLVQTLYAQAQLYFSERDTFNTQRFIKEAIIDCTSHVEYKYIENESDFREKLLFSEQFGGIRVAGSIQQVILCVQYLISFLSISFILIEANTVLFLILLATSIPAVILSIMQKDDEYKSKTKGMKDGAMSVHLFYIAAGANEHCRSMGDLRFNNIFPWVKEKWKAVSERYLREKQTVTKKYVLYNSIADLLRNGVYIAVMLIIVRSIYADPALGLGLFALVYTAAGQMQTITAKLFTGAARFFGDIPYMKDFFDLQDTAAEKLENRPVTIDEPDIVFENVHFTYPNSPEETLRGITVTIRKGEKVAIVGRNGSGKSTFIALLCGLYKPDTGSITIGGRNAADHLRAIRNTLSVVFQNFGRYETTIRENIAISDSSRAASDEAILSEARKIGADRIISAQPGGPDEEVGRFSKTGNNLSGGQWQKIALTRAMFRSGAKIMILDEPTSALDPMAEAELYRNFAEFTEDKTTILISHRLGITGIVDRVLVFEDGRIIEDGSHAELMTLGGVYKKMYEVQLQNYR
ncbi:ABC transporter ATP-binding protein [Breznakiella homolactica]|uniref:ABC transporter ATP-binding protein n=1 Tax=Breznakiella homolactica TaxID=2798577 RepID=A0A7T7XQ71_9SPIR|nr:ABC transporter ATP-binding protein [Breznakiella homolactica]QQO10485.1 ABC transporter ATP-binding protein/permease [Breznakiella homolactica]